MTLWVVLGTALAAAVVVVVALPFLREPAPSSDSLDALGDTDRRRLDAQEARDRALATLRELEADHRAGRVSDDDYRSVIGAVRRDAAEALRTLDAVEAGTRSGETKTG